MILNLIHVRLGKQQFIRFVENGEYDAFVIPIYGCEFINEIYLN